MSLELCKVLEFRPSFFADLLLKADDTTSAITHRQDLASVIKAYSGEQVLLVDGCDVGFSKLTLCRHVQWLYRLLSFSSWADICIIHAQVALVLLWSSSYISLLLEHLLV